MNDLLIWVGFLIIYSIVQSLGKKKKPKGKEPVPVSSDGENRPTTLKDALREIQEAFEQAQQPPAPTAPEPVQEPAVQPKRQFEPVVRKPKIEPEFHSLEKPVYSSNLEKKTSFKESYSRKSLETKTTYDQQFRPSSIYSDDNFQHAHPDPVRPVKRKSTKRATKKALPDLLKDRTTLSQLFLFQEILGKPVSRRRHDERSRW